MTIGFRKLLILRSFGALGCFYEDVSPVGLGGVSVLVELLGTLLKFYFRLTLAFLTEVFLEVSRTVGVFSGVDDDCLLILAVAAGESGIVSLENLKSPFGAVHSPCGGFLLGVEMGGEPSVNSEWC